jgi:hypothetical protein
VSQGSRGKFAEGKVRDSLNTLAQQSDFNFMRLPDARAGSFVPTTADFLVGNRGIGWMLEVKEVAHEFRLPRYNYPTEQRSRVRMWEMAGFKSLVVVAFLPLKGAAYRADRAMWRSASLSYFTGDDTSSWDMRGLPLLTLAEALTDLAQD